MHRRPRAARAGPRRVESGTRHEGGKAEADLSLATEPDCIEGVPKGSPDGARILLFRACAGEPHIGVTLTDSAGSYRRWIADGFGGDWNPAYRGDAVRNGSEDSDSRVIR